MERYAIAEKANGFEVIASANKIYCMLHYCSNVSHAVIIVNSVITHVILPKLYMKILAHCLLYKQSKSIVPPPSTLSPLSLFPFPSPLLFSLPPLFSSYLPSFFFPFPFLSNTHMHMHKHLLLRVCLLIIIHLL